MSANLDLIRACAVLCVAFAHLYERYFRTHGYPNYVSETAWHFGQMGVIIFFVHTSYVLMQSLERTGGRVGEFYIRRAFRIYPLSILVVTIAFILQVSPWTWAEYLANTTLTFNLFYIEGMTPSLWTLPLEVQMYVVLPALFWFALKRPIWAMALVWIGAALVALAQPYISGRLTALEFAPCFIAGVLSWRLSKWAPKRIPGYWWPLAFAATWAVFLIASRGHADYFRWAYALTLGLSIPWFADMKLGPVNVMAHIVAKYSYGIYLVHVAIIGAAFSLPLPAIAQIALAFCGIAATAFALFHLVEDPMIKLGRRVGRGGGSPTPAVVRAAA